MDAVTHTLVALAMWRAGVRVPKAGVWGGLTMLVAANIADAESFARLAGAAVYIRNYHGMAHSIAGTVLLAAGIAGLAFWGLKRAGRPVRFGGLAAVALLGSASHLLLDLLHGYGVRLLWPFLSERFGFPLIASYDLSNLAALLLALSVPLLLNIVNAEIGAPRVSGARAAITGLTIVAALLPLRLAWEKHAEAASASVLLEDQESHRLHPSPFLPWRWYLVQETSISYLLQEVDGVGQSVSAGMLRFRKPIPNNLLLAARDTPTGRAFLDLAVYPLFSLEEGSRGIVVRIRDLQFYVPGAGNRPYSVEVEINSQLQVLSERAYF